MTQDRTEQLMPGGIPRWIRLYDDGGEADRYTCVYTRYNGKYDGHLYVGMSGAPFHPQGICQHGTHTSPIDCLNGRPPAVGRKCHLGTRITWDQLPEECKKVVLQDYAQIWSLILPPLAAPH